MAKARKTESQIRRILKQAAEGADVPRLVKKHNVSLGTFYNWKKKYDVSVTQSTEASTEPANEESTKKRKRGRPKGSSKKGRKAGRPKGSITATQAVAPASASTSVNSKLTQIENRIKALEAEIIKLKIEYADAALGR